MRAIEIAAQVISIIAMCLNILSYQAKNKRLLISMQMVGCTLFGVSYFMLGATMGGLLNVVGLARSVVFLWRERFRADHPLWTAAFVLAYLSSYAATFTLLGKEATPQNFAIELLPVIAATIVTVSYRMKGTRPVRLLGLICSPSWLIYNVFSRSIGGIFCEAISLVSIIVGLIRYDLRRADEPPRGSSGDMPEKR